jgi:hypothetical protein
LYHGYLKVLDEQDLVVEVGSEEDYEKLSEALVEKFGNEVFLEKLQVTFLLSLYLFVSFHGV